MPRMPLILAGEGRRGGVGRLAGPADFGSGRGEFAIGQGVADAGKAMQYVGSVGARVYDHEQRSKVDRQTAEAGRALLLEAERISTETTDPGKYTELYDEARSRIMEDMGAGLPSGYRGLYDEKMAEVDFRVSTRLRGLAREKSLAQAGAHSQAFLADIADLEARAADPEERAFYRQWAANHIGGAAARGAFTPDEEQAAIEAYNGTVAKAAVLEGLSTDPVGLLDALVSRSGPFAEMREPDRQAAILRAQAGVQSLQATALNAASAARSEIRFEAWAWDREQRDMARAARMEMTGLALAGELTSAELVKRAGAMWSDPEGFAKFAEMVAKGGSFPPGPADPAYYAAVQRMAVEDPVGFQNFEPDPFMLGTQYQEVVKLQRDKAEGTPTTIDQFWRLINERMERNIDSFRTFSPSTWTGPGQDVLEGRFRVMAAEAWTAFQLDKGHTPDAVEREQLLDGVVMRFADKYAAGDTAETGLIGLDPIFPIPVAARSEVEAELRARGIPINSETMQQAYEQFQAQGFYSEYGEPLR